MAVRFPVLVRMHSIRFRLFVSYLLLLFLTLTATVAAIVVMTGARSAPPQQTWQQLTMLVRGLNRDNLMNEFTRAVPDVQETTLGEIIDTYARQSDVRIVRFQFDGDGVPFVIYDSDRVFERYHQLSPDRFELRYGPPSARSRLNLSGMVQQIHGTFDENGTQWLFSGLMRLPPIGESIPTSEMMLTGVLIATPRPPQSLQGSLADFGLDLFQPLAQAGFIGLVVVALLAYLISQYIARPLQALNEAATAIARGDLSHRAPVSGPHEIRSLAAAFNNMSDEVRKTQQAQRDFLTNVSHDLKTPLTSIQGYSQSIIDGVNPPHEAAPVIYAEALRMSRMVNRLIELVQMQSGQLPLRKTRLNLSDVARGVAQRLSVVAAEKRIQLTALTPPTADILADGDRLEQVLDNLIGNAIKYTGEGGEIYVETRQMPDGVQLIITDTGEGIPYEHIERVFERFYRVDESRVTEDGTGLGLSITQEIVHLHGGQIDVQSVAGRGTRFTIWLPRPPQD